MLNQNDRRRLEQIERQLRDEDPEWARRFAQWPPPPTEAHRIRTVIVIVLGVVAMLLSLVALLPAVSFLVLVATGAAYLWLRRRGRDGAG